jgi:hypothetical protein
MIHVSRLTFHPTDAFCRLRYAESGHAGGKIYASRRKQAFPAKLTARGVCAMNALLYGGFASH